MPSSCIATLFFLFSFVIADCSAWAQEPPYTLSLDASLVSLDATVLDSNGRPVTSLTREDFQIYENGVLQEIRNFNAVTTPHHILVMVDCGGSDDVRKKFEMIHNILQTFFQALNRHGDSFAAAEFGGKVNLVMDWTTPPWKFVVRSNDSACKGTDFYGMAEWAARKAHAVDVPQSVVVFGDGGRVEKRKVSDRDFKDLEQRIEDSGVPFYFVMINTDRNPPQSVSKNELAELQRVRLRIEELAGVSGGRLVVPKTAADIVPTAQSLGKELGVSYRFSYRPGIPERDGKFRRIEVRVPGRAGLAVRQSRDGYYAK
jgi:Ca-activated chloride channel family protein